MNLLRPLELGAWLVAVTAHFLAYTLSAQPETADWYASLPSYRAAVFGLTRLPLWLAGLCVLLALASRILPTALIAD